jgi:hypothetical protein
MHRDPNHEFILGTPVLMVANTDLYVRKGMDI